MALVEVPDIGNVEFPDDMSKEEMSLAINKRFFPHLVKAQPPSVYGATKAPPVGINEVQAGEMSQYGLLPGQPLAGGMVLGSNLRAPVAPTSTMVDKTTTEPSWEDPTNPWAQLGVGARLEAAHLPAKYASLPLAAVPGVDRAKFSDYLESEAQKKLGVYDVPEAEGWTNKVARGLGRAPVMMGELLGLGKFISPLASAVSAVPKVASILGAAPRLGPMAESAATFGLQGLLEPHEPLKQAALGVGMGAGFGALAPYAKPVRMLGAGGLGLGTEYIANPNATPEELAASGTVMGLLAGIGGRRGRRVNEKLNITEEDFAPPSPPPDRAPRSGAWIWSGQGDVFEPHAPQTSADLWARNQRIIDEAYGRVPTTTEPPPAPVPTGGLQEPAAERAIGELPEVGTTTPKETLPAPTEHPVLNALREVFPDMDSARLEIERLEREGVLGPVNLHPEFIPGIGHVLRSGKPSFSGLSVDYGEFLDDLNTVRETDPKAFEEAKAEADKNMSAFKELTAQSAADEEAFFADLNEKFIQGQRIATEGTRPSLEFTPDELEQRRLLGQTEGRVLTDVTGNIVGTNVPSGAPPTEIAAITPTVDWFGERPGTRRPTTPTTTVPEVTTEGQSQAIGLEGKRLQTGMLQSAVADFFSRSKANKESALQWIMDKTSKDAFSFEGVMKSFDLDPDEVRDRIISGKVDPNAFRSLKFYSGLGWLPEAWNELKKGSKWLEGIATKMEMKPGKLGVNLKQLISERSTDIGNQAAANTTAIELFQNSLDNARPGTVPKIGIHLERIWREDVTPRKREVRGWLYDPDIAKEYNWKLRFSDDGTGMSPEVVKENLMTYGGVGTKGEFSRGGYGIASTFLFNFPLETTIDTVALVNGQKIRTMVRTSKERFSMGDFDWGSERVADSTPTGTTYTAVMPSGLTESFLDGFKSYANKLRSPAEVSGGGEVVSYGNAPYKNIVKPLSEYPQVASSVPFKIGKSSGTIYFEEGSDSWSEPNKEGVYTFSTRIINKGLPLSVNLPKDAFGGIRYEPDFTVKVDYEKTPAPKDNLEEYPFFDNRKSLRDEQVAGIKAILYPKLREMERERVTQRAEEFKQIYKDSPRLLGTKILFDFPSYLHKDVTAALQENLAPLRGAIKIMQTFRDFMTKVGVTFDEMVITLDPTVRGFKTNPHLTGHDLYAFNPVTMNKMLAEDIADAKRAGISEPAMRASNFTHTLIHELAHMEDMSHGQNWGLVVARLYVKATHEGLVNNVERMANAYFTKYGDALEELGKRLSSLPTGRFRLGTSSLGQPRELSYTGEPATTRGPETARGTSDLGIAKPPTEVVGDPGTFREWAKRTAGVDVLENSVPEFKQKYPDLFAKYSREMDAWLGEEPEPVLKEGAEGDRMRAIANAVKVHQKFMNEGGETFEELDQAVKDGLIRKEDIPEIYSRVDQMVKQASGRDTTLYTGIDPIAFYKTVEDTVRGARKWLTEKSILGDISHRFLNDKWFSTDVSFGEGKWHRENEGEVKNRFDKYNVKPGTVQADTSEHIPLGDSSIPNVAWDPPYLFRYGASGESIMSDKFKAFSSMEERNKVFNGTLKEISRILEPDGVALVKIMDYYRSVKANNVVNNTRDIINTAQRYGLELQANYLKASETDKNLYAQAKHERLPVHYLVFKKTGEVDPNIARAYELREQTTPTVGQMSQEDALGQRLFGFEPEPKGTKLYSGLAFAPKALEEFKNMLFKGEKLPGGGGISWMSRKYRQNFAIPFWTSKIYENFKPFYETANARREIFTRDATGAMDKVNSWLSMSDEEKASARDLLLTIEGKRLAANPSPMYDSYRVGNITYLKPSDVHMQEYAKWLATKNLSPKTTSFLMAWKQVMAKAFTDHYNESVATGETDPGTLQDLMDNVGNVPNYFPHMWYGDYYVEGKNIDGKVVARVPLSVNILERTLGASGKYQKVVEGLKKDPAFAGLTWGPPQKTSELERFWLNSPVPIDTLERLLDESAKRLEADPNLAPLAQAYRKVIPQEVAQILKTRGFGNFAKRRGVLGYEKEDITKVFYDYVTGVYGGLSKAQAARDYTNLMFKTKPNSEDYKLLSEFVEDEMSTYGKFDRAMDNMRTAFFVKYLGARIKPAVVNLTNMSTSSIPLLGIYTQGESNSTALHAKAALDISKQYIKEFPTHQSRVGIRGLPTDNVLAPDEVKAQVDLLTDDTIQHQMMNEYRGRLKDNLNWNWQAFRYLSAPMEMTEWYIRATTALSAYRAFRDGKITHQPTLDKYGLTKGQPVDMNQGDNYANALDFAKDLVAMAHGDYSQYNKPAILRSGAAGAIGRSMYTFRFFNHHLVEMWNWMLRHEETGRGKAAFAKSMFSQALVGGLKAAPIVSFLMWAYNQWNKESPEDVLRESYPRLGPLWDGAFEGAPGMAGIYLGGSLEVGFPTNVQEAIGIPAAITQDIMNGAAAWTSGNKGRAFEYLAPLVVTRDLLSAYRGYVSGERTIGGRPISTPGEIEPTKLTAPEAIAKALGFRPMSTEARWRLNQTVGDMEAYRKNTQSKYADRYTNAIADEDYDKAADIIDEVIAYNEIWLSKDRPEMVIRKDELTSALRTRLRAKQPSRSMMGRALSLGEGYGLQQ